MSGVFFFIILFQVKSAISLDRTRKQWVDLGVLKEACITRPETCGAAGGAITLWIRVTHSDNTWRHIITARSQGVASTKLLDLSLCIK